MVNTNKLKSIMVEQGMSAKKVASAIGLSEATFYRRLESKRFYSDEIENLVTVLGIENPAPIFFDDWSA